METKKLTKNEVLWFLKSVIDLMENEKIYSEDKRKIRLDRGIGIAKKLIAHYSK